MGCDSSKQADISRDRTRARAFSSNVAIPANRTIPGMGDAPGFATQQHKDPDIVYAGSYTQKHLRQYDFLDNLVTHTTSAFIDVLVSKENDSLPVEDITRRRLKYADFLSNAVLSVTAMPIPEDGGAELSEQDVLALAEPLYTEDVRAVRMLNDDVTSALESFTFPEDNMRLVLSYEQLQEEVFPTRSLSPVNQDDVEDENLDGDEYEQEGEEEGFRD